MKKRIIIIGAGFAGLTLARHLEYPGFEIILIDRLNHHQFQPLFYQVATSRLEPSSISFPLRKIFQDSKYVQVRMAEVNRVNTTGKSIDTTLGRLSYDYLVIATGSRTNFFGNQNLMKWTYTLKTTYEAIHLRNRILLSFEEVYNQNPDKIDTWSNIVIIGAGPTGVELAGAFAETRNTILRHDYPDFDFSKLKITLIEAGHNPLSSMSTFAQNKARRYLKELKVELITGAFVQDYDGTTVFLNNRTEIKSGNVIWAAGIIGNMIEGFRPESFTRGNRFLVDPYNCVEGYKDVYAIGDIALMRTTLYPEGHPQVANVAINQALNLAKNFKNSLSGKALIPYEYRNLGSMATIGKHKAVVDLPGIKFSGTVAWLIWMFLHLMLILSVKSKLIIFINWAWSYLTNDTSLRLILNDERPGQEKPVT